jgi:hypothetical protein
MWIFSTVGFFSVVVDQQRPGTMLIRARCGVDAANLWKQFHGELPSMTEPVSNELRDYRWRLSCSKDDWVRLAGRLAADIDYGNFKDACHKEPSQQSKSSALLKIWATMVDIQRQEQHGDVFKRYEPDDAAWEALTAKVDLPDDQKKKPAKRKTGKKAKRLF